MLSIIVILYIAVVLLYIAVLDIIDMQVIIKTRKKVDLFFFLCTYYEKKGRNCARSVREKYGHRAVLSADNKLALNNYLRT